MSALLDGEEVPGVLRELLVAGGDEGEPGARERHRLGVEARLLVAVEAAGGVAVGIALVRDEGLVDLLPRARAGSRA